MFYSKNNTKKVWEFDKQDDKPIQFDTPDEAQLRIEELSNLYPQAEFKIQVVEVYGAAYFNVLINHPE